MTTRKLVGLGIAVIVAIGALGTRLEAAAPAIKLVPVLTGLSAPLFVTNARDGSHRLFIVEQGGVIKVLQPGQAAPTVFLDITSQVLAGGEQGLLGLTFHPQFASNRRFVVDYTRQPDGATVIAEYQVPQGTPHSAATTETVLLVIPQPFANHNGGMVEFGPDGFLYIAMGDGGSGNDPGNRAQDITQLLGKILRIDVDQPNGAQPYAAPSSNPFFGATAGADEIYAYGLRNPWRFAFDRSTGDLYAGDVGQNAVEEVDLITLGGNYGWRIWEGTSCTGNDPGLCSPADFLFPIAQYGHTGGRCAVTGGYVYRGAQSSLPVGSYVYGDYCSGEIFVLQNGTSRVALDTALNISSFGEDESGEVYVVGLGGTVHRIATLTTAGDFDADGKADILWRHTAGDVGLWLMNGGSVSSAVGLGTVPTAWTIAEVGDFNGDGKADILWRRATTGEVAIWFMNGGSVSGTGGLGAITTDWTIQGALDFNADGKADILWRHTSGSTGIWLLNGVSVIGTSSIGTVPVSWVIQP